MYRKTPYKPVYEYCQKTQCGRIEQDQKIVNNWPIFILFKYVKNVKKLNRL